MRKNLQNWPKIVKILKNGLGVSGRGAFVYDHVYWLEVDSEPAGPGLDAKRFSWTCDVVALSKIFQNVQISTFKKPVFLNFLANRWSDFQKNFFGWKAFRIRFFEDLDLPNPPHRLAAIPVCIFFVKDLTSPRCKIQNLFKQVGSFFKKLPCLAILGFRVWWVTKWSSVKSRAT